MTNYVNKVIAGFLALLSLGATIGCKPDADNYKHKPHMPSYNYRDEQNDRKYYRIETIDDENPRIINHKRKYYTDEKTGEKMVEDDFYIDNRQ